MCEIVHLYWSYIMCLRLQNRVKLKTNYIKKNHFISYYFGRKTDNWPLQYKAVEAYKHSAQHNLSYKLVKYCLCIFGVISGTEFSHTLQYTIINIFPST